MREVEIPGGTAMLRERADMKMRHRRIMEVAAVMAQPAVSKARTALKTDARGALVLDKNDRPVVDKAKADAIRYTTDEANAMLEAQDATIFAMLESWSLPEPMPQHLEDIGDMDPAVYDALALASKDDGADVLVGETSFKESPDRDRPTGSSASSNGSSTVEPLESGSRSTRKSGRGGASTRSGRSTD